MFSYEFIEQKRNEAKIDDEKELVNIFLKEYKYQTDEIVKILSDFIDNNVDKLMNKFIEMQDDLINITYFVYRIDPICFNKLKYRVCVEDVLRLPYRYSDNMDKYIFKYIDEKIYSKYKLNVILRRQWSGGPDGGGYTNKLHVSLKLNK